ncbi:Ribosome_biogenesis protein ERB1 [Hexamita inflata]|uniref:Ribosome biogenesis protein ERB1 n=1 Tax=Hexamita inflata TaxID=28002 RepID=A0AA86N6B3_9EUKA|nr:Ribosome biogenesis protein ERB1 [Hexamita inflata]
MSESSSDTLSTHEEVRNEEVSNPSSFEISEPTEDSSEDDFLNRALPNEEVQGYDVHGQVIELPAEKQPGERLQEYMDLQQNPSLLFKRVLDKNTGRMVELTDEQLQKLDNLLKYNKTFTKIDIQERPELKFIDNTYKFSIYANNLPTKSQFCRKEELKRVAYCGRQANFDFKKYQLFQNYFLYQFQLYINSMFSSVSFLFYYFFQPFGHRVNQMIDDIQRDLLQRPLYFFIQQVICGTFFRGNV